MSPEERLAETVRHEGRRVLAALVRTLGSLQLAEDAVQAKRLVRARQKIASARIPYRVPTDAELPERLPAVLAVVHLIATESHAPSSGGDVVRVDLEAQALRLARLLGELMPGEPEVLSLLALLLFTAARRSARVDAEGEQVLLADQDRFRWDRAAVSEGSALLSEAVRRSRGVAGYYQLPGAPGRLPLHRGDLAGHRLGPHRRPL